MEGGGGDRCFPRSGLRKQDPILDRESKQLGPEGGLRGEQEIAR